MSIITLLLVILMIGVVWALIRKFVGLPPVVDNVLTILFIVIVVIMLLQVLGVNVPGLGSLHIR